jgi:hypothetical protein
MSPSSCAQGGQPAQVHENLARRCVGTVGNARIVLGVVAIVIVIITRRQREQRRKPVNARLRARSVVRHGDRYKTHNITHAACEIGGRMPHVANTDHA